MSCRKSLQTLQFDTHRVRTFRGDFLNQLWRWLSPFICFLSLGMVCSADGHGPEFGYSTTTLGAGDYSIGSSFMWRSGVPMLGPMLSYGITENLQLSASAPFHLRHGDHRTGRFSALMPGQPEVELLLAWRFYHSLTGVGTRNEATAYGGVSELTQHYTDGVPMARQIGFYSAIAAGHVSRRYDVWAGAGYQRYENFSSNEPDHQSNTFLSSLTLGWRPWLFNNSKSKTDLRFFLETTGERVGLAYLNVPNGTTVIGHQHEQLAAADASTNEPSPFTKIVLPNTGGTALFSGPTFLWTCGSLAYQAGILLPLYDQPNGTQKHERYRVGAGITYYFFGKHK